MGLRAAKDTRYGMMRLTTTGRRTGLERSVILGYLEDGPNLVTMAMNGWGDGEPACGSISEHIPQPVSTSSAVDAR